MALVRTASRVVVASVVAATAAALVPQPAVAAQSLVPVATGLDSPRGVAVGPRGRVTVAEIDGAINEVRDGKLVHVAHVPATFIAPAVARGGKYTYVLTAEGAPGSGAASLYRLSPGSSTPVLVKDIAAYQATDPDPNDLEGAPTDSNPFGVAALPDGTVLVSDAAGNDLLRVWPDGTTVTVARLKPRVVEVPTGLPPTIPGEGGEPPTPVPPAGTKIPSEAVATSVTVGADGYYYVGELRGFPATPGTSQVWRIKPGSVNAVCDPANPSTGDCQRYADGFTSIVDLGAAPNGSLLVDELVTGSWLKWELQLAPPIGGLFRIPPGGGTPRELVAGQLTLPGGTEVGPRGRVYVTSPVFGVGVLARVAS